MIAWLSLWITLQTLSALLCSAGWLGHGLSWMKIVSFSWAHSAHMSSSIGVFFSRWRFHHVLAIFPTLTLNFSHLRYSVMSPISQCGDSCEHVHNSVLLTDFATYFLITSIWVTSVQRGWNQEQLPTSYVIYCHSGSIVINPHLYSTYSLLNVSSTVTSSQCLLESFCVCFFFLTALHFLCEKSVLLVLVARLLLFGIFMSPDLN